MKVPTKTSTEDVKITNVFWDEYAPEEYEFICDDCLAEEVESLKEDILWLSEDILDHDDILEMLWEKIQAVEDDQLQDVENLSNVVDILGCLQEANKLMLDSIVSQNEQNKILKDEIKGVDKAWICLFRFLVIWNVILTVLFWIYVF